MSDQWQATETYKSIITLSVEALKMLALANGGAAVAVLTYLGNLSSRASPHAVLNIKPALLCYCAGLLVTIAALIFAYGAQLRLFQEFVQGRRQAHHWFVGSSFLLGDRRSDFVRCWLLYGGGCACFLMLKTNLRALLATRVAFYHAERDRNIVPEFVPKLTGTR